MKYLLLFAVLGVLWWVWTKRQSGDVVKNTRPAPPAEDMVVCAHCGDHLPVSESLKEGERFYCSEAHRLAGRPAGR